MGHVYNFLIVVLVLMAGLFIYSFIPQSTGTPATV